jgi:uncharacterized protein (DUF58 family)
VNLLPLLITVIVLAFLTGSDGLFYLAYVLGGVWLLTLIWMRQALTGLRVERRFPERAFHGEVVQASLVVANQGRWPVLWLKLHESLPLDLHVPNFEQRVVSLASKERTTLEYPLKCQRRGYYRLGPLSLLTGDYFDLTSRREAVWPAEPFIVYPRVVPLSRLAQSIPSQLPFGNLASQRRIFEDPSRFFGVRDYRPGDSLRQINWKSSARAGQLQVKRFQPAIALNTMLILNLNDDEYALRSRTPSGEMGIVVAASVAAHLIEQRQPVGLAVLGMDAVTQQVGLQIIPPVRGREHLMRLLEILARAERASTTPFVRSLDQASARLGWGSTAVVITPGASPHLEEALLQMRRRGVYVLLVATDPLTAFRSLRGRLEQIGIPARWVTDDRDLDVWR